MKWQLAIFDKADGHWVEDVPIADITTEEIRELLRLPDTDPMCYEYPVDLRVATEIEKKTNRKLDLDRFAYFLESSD